MIEIDGRSGGGQMLRTALTLSAVKNREFRMENIRGNRSNPGLKNQHLECVKTVQRLCNAKVEGAEIGSQELVFRPQELQNLSFTANIGTAGSLTLLLDTVLPVTSQFDSSFRLNVKGGTDVKWSPTANYLKHVKIPLIEKFGFKGSIDVEKTGYYPSGGGEIVLHTGEHSLQEISLTNRGKLQKFEIYSKASRELEEQDVVDRQADEAARKLKNSHITVPIEKNVEYEKTDSTGSSLLVKAVYENYIAGFDALGEQGKRSEKVAQEAVQQFKQFHASEAAVDEYMADQLLVFMALVGGEIKVQEITSHIETSLEVLERFGCRYELNRSKVTNVKVIP